MKCTGASLRGHHKQAKEGIFLAAVCQLQHFGDAFSVSLPSSPFCMAGARQAGSRECYLLPSFGWRFRVQEGQGMTLLYLSKGLCLCLEG